MRRFTAAQAKTYKRRWALANAAEIAELRATSMTRKFQQLTALMSSASMFGADKSMAAEQTAIRARWQQLRKAMRG